MLPPPRPALWPLRPFASADVTDELLPDGNLVHFLPGLWAGQTGVAPDRTRRR